MALTLSSAKYSPILRNGTSLVSSVPDVASASASGAPDRMLSATAGRSAEDTKCVARPTATASTPRIRAPVSPSHMPTPSGSRGRK